MRTPALLSSTMKIPIAILTLLLSACANSGTFQHKPQRHADRFGGNRAALADCTIGRLQADSRWVISGLGYEVRSYPDIDATEVYAFPLGALPGTYPRNMPTNPDAVGVQEKPVVKVLDYAAHPYTGPSYSFLLMLKRIDDDSVLATVKGNEYEGGIAWESLAACAAASNQAGQK
ncbi:hypothetical protein SAMN05216414_10771 [Nitrosovibrio sp. Nv17]|nr:hypothetical protein SAMN05216414_10771 [Nitrosovibrio sp. Nv17]